MSQARNKVIKAIEVKALASQEGELIDNGKLPRAAGKLADAIIAAAGESEALGIVHNMDADALADHVRTAEYGQQFEVDFKSYRSR